jgi:outer membrane protein assembly factor BamB
MSKSIWSKTAAVFAVCSTTALLSSCGLWLGEAETILEGDRIALRQPRATIASGGVAALPPTIAITDWPQVGGAANRSIGHVAGTATLNRLWSTSIGAGSDSESRVTAPPVAAGGRIFALDAAAQVTAVSTSGNIIWKADLTPEDEDPRDGFGGGLAAVGDVLVAATGFGQVIGLNAANGERRWTFQAESPIRSSPAVSQGRVVVVTRGGMVMAIDAATGKEAWRVTGLEGGASMMGGGGSAPAISGEVVAAPYPSGDIGVIRLRDGRRGWSEPIGGTMRGVAISLISDVTSAPVMAAGRIYAGSVSGRLASFEIPTGRRIWARNIGSYNPVSVAGDSLFVVTEDARLLALRSATGVTIWEAALPRFDDPEDRSGTFAYGGPLLVGSKLVVVSTDKMIYRFDAATGKPEHVAALPGPSSIPPIAAGGVIYVVDESGDLHAYK